MHFSGPSSTGEECVVKGKSVLGVTRVLHGEGVADVDGFIVIGQDQGDESRGPSGQVDQGGDGSGTVHHSPDCPNGGSLSTRSRVLVLVVGCGMSPLGSVIVEGREGGIWCHSAQQPSWLRLSGGATGCTTLKSTFLS